MVFENGTIVPATLMDEAGGRDLACCGVVNQMASDLSGLRAKPLEQKKVVECGKTYFKLIYWNGSG